MFCTFMKSFSLQFPWKLPHLRHGPKTLKTACLLRKRTPLSSNYVPDYVGFEIPGNDTPSFCWYFFHLQCFLNQLPCVCNVSCCRQWEKFSLAIILPFRQICCGLRSGLQRIFQVELFSWELDQMTSVNFFLFSRDLMHICVISQKGIEKYKQ